MYTHVRYLARHARMVLTPDMPQWPSGVSLAAFALLSGTMNAFSSLLWIPAGIGLIVVAVLMTGEILTEYFGMEKAERRVFLWEREITTKFLLLTLIPVSLLMDLSIYLIAAQFPQDFWILDRGYLFLTGTTEIWLIAAAVAQITRNVSQAAGPENVPPTLGVVARQLQWVIRNLRLVDKTRWKALHDDGSEPPRRWLDDMTAAEAARVVELISSMRAEDVPADPKTLLAPKPPTEAKAPRANTRKPKP